MYYFHILKWIILYHVGTILYMSNIYNIVLLDICIKIFNTIKPFKKIIWILNFGSKEINHWVEYEILQFSVTNCIISYFKILVIWTIYNHPYRKKTFGCIFYLLLINNIFYILTYNLFNLLLILWYSTIISS